MFVDVIFKNANARDPRNAGTNEKSYAALERAVQNKARSSSLARADQGVAIRTGLQVAGALLQSSPRRCAARYGRKVAAGLGRAQSWSTCRDVRLCLA